MSKCPSRGPASVHCPYAAGQVKRPELVRSGCCELLTTNSTGSEALTLALRSRRKSHADGFAPVDRQCVDNPVGGWNLWSSQINLGQEPMGPSQQTHEHIPSVDSAERFLP